MKLGSNQPYFFPYIGYFDLIYQSNFWVVYDTAQYIRHGWVNRNRVLHPTNGWQYIVVPRMNHHHAAPINEIRIAEDGRWRDKLLGQLQHYKNKAPFFRAVVDLVSACLQDTRGSLSRLNVESLERICDYLGIPFSYVLESEMTLESIPEESPGDRTLRIAMELRASEYINPPGGARLYEPSKFDEAGIKLTIQRAFDFVYNCDGYEFQPNLSIIDVLMWNPPKAIHAYLASRSRENQEP